MKPTPLLTVLLMFLNFAPGLLAAERTSFVVTPLSESFEVLESALPLGIEFLGEAIQAVDVYTQTESRLNALFKNRLGDKDFVQNPDAGPIEQSIVLLISALRHSTRNCGGSIVCRNRAGYFFAETVFVKVSATRLDALSPGQKRARLTFQLSLKNVAGAAFEDSELRDWAYGKDSNGRKFGEPIYVDVQSALLNGPLPSLERFGQNNGPKWYFWPEVSLGEFSTLITEDSPRVAKVIGKKVEVRASNGLTYQTEVSCANSFRVPNKRLHEDDIRPLENSRAVQYLETLSKQGDADASEMLADLYTRGARGLPRDPELAFKAWKTAAAQGSLAGAQMTQILLRKGEGVAKNENEANHYLIVAAGRGDCAAKAFVAFTAALNSPSEGVRKAFREELELLPRQFPESSAGFLYWAALLLHEAKFNKSVFPTVASDLRRAAVYGSLKALALYSRVFAGLPDSSPGGIARLNDRLESCITHGEKSGWLPVHDAEILRKGTLEQIIDSRVP